MEFVKSWIKHQKLSIKTYKVSVFPEISNSRKNDNFISFMWKKLFKWFISCNLSTFVMKNMLYVKLEDTWQHT